VDETSPQVRAALARVWERTTGTTLDRVVVLEQTTLALPASPAEVKLRTGIFFASHNSPPDGIRRHAFALFSTRIGAAAQNASLQIDVNRQHVPFTPALFHFDLMATSS
jgi:hypothetical protein